MLAAEVASSAQTTEPDREVYYAEVRAGVSFRDVLVGLAYHLRRSGIDEPFALSVYSSLTTEELLARLARSYSALPRPWLLLVDLVEGTSDPAFARDAATFVRALASSVCRVAISAKKAPCAISLRIPTKSAGDSERRRPPVPIEAGRGFR